MFFHILCRCVFVCGCQLTTDGRRSPMNGDPLLTAFVCICSNGGAQTLAVAATVTVASVCKAVSIEPGHVHLDSTHTVRSTTQTLAVGEKSRPNLAWGKRGEVLLRGRVVFNNSKRKKESDETWGQKNVGQPLVEGGSDELRDGQQEEQPRKTHHKRNVVVPV